MSSADPAPSDSVLELLKQAAATAYCRPALRALGDALPLDDTILHTALDQAAETRDAKSFSHLYAAALFAGRRIPARVLELGGALVPEAMLLLHTALRLDGNIAEPLAAAVRSGRMGSERDAAALVTALLDYERRETPVPTEFLILTRRTCRVCSRTGAPMAVRSSVSLPSSPTTRWRLPSLTRTSRTTVAWTPFFPPSLTVYQHKGHRLRFSRSGEPKIEEAYSTHLVVVGKRNPSAASETASAPPGPSGQKI
jgi:hypothetical protein